MDVPAEIRRIPAEATIDLRWAVLRPGFPRETAIFAGDEDPGTIHLGAYSGNQLVAIASLYEAALPDDNSAARPMQLRGMATHPEVRGAGYGRTLLQGCENAAREAGCDLLWCNARQTAVEFYRRNGWVVCSEEFDIPTVGPHFRMRRPLAPSPYAAGDRPAV